jgi:hypothetical protein
MDITETAKATVSPIVKITISILVKSNPNFISFNVLAPNMIGIDMKNEYSTAI